MKRNKQLNRRPQWISGVTFTCSGNLYSTAGVSNATDGSLAFIRDLFGAETMKAVMERTHYPHPSLQVRHQSLPVTALNKANIIQKTLFNKDPNIGVLPQEGIDEFTLSAILDTYHRSFPSALKAYSQNNIPVTSKFGLLLLPSGEWSELDAIDELHILAPGALSPTQKDGFTGIQLVKYDSQNKAYIIDVCLQRLTVQYGSQFQTCVKRLLDYN